MVKKRWKIKDSAPAEIVERLAKDINVSSVIANLLWHRGITTYDEAKLFFRPQLAQLHDPFLMKDMDKAIERIESAIKNNEKILIYGDYDVDGTTSVALVYSFFKNQHQTPSSSPKGGEFGREGNIPSYHTTDKQMWKLLHSKAVEMRNNPTPAENIMWQLLRKHGVDFHFRRQHLIDRFIVDFVCLEKSLIIEVDGDIHDYQKQEDEDRTDFLNRNGFTVIRFKNEEVIGNTDNVLKQISNKLHSLPSSNPLHAQSSPPLGEIREGVWSGLIDYYIPDRYKEGYGISTAGIDFAAANNFSLIIALDCGIKAVDKIEYANQKNIDFIICDHHLPGEKIPNAVAVLDPKRKDCPYPYKELSGCGIGFKLIQAFAQKNNIPIENLEQYLDLTAISIAADIVPITGENRILAHYGLKHLNNSPRAGIRAMLELTKMKKELTITDIVFVIGPRINAAGRMESGKKAVEMLISATAEHAVEAGNYLDKNNSDRRDLDIYTTQQALQMVADSSILQTKKTTVLFDPNWHKGVIGIVASRLTESYYRPTIMLTQSNGVVSGSARSVKDFDVYEAISACSDLLIQFGGHKFAAGLTMLPENVKAFQEKFEKVVSSTITDEMLVPEIEIDAEINLSDVTPGFYNILKQFSPFGPGNMNPNFMTKNVSDKGYASIVGKNHLKMELLQTSPPVPELRSQPSPSVRLSKERGVSIPAIGFGMDQYYEFVAKKNPFTICYHINEQEWEGKSYLQLQVKDLKKAQ
ncbi:MAG: single-stranded-DNA-specific exonuclease RecJ [Bacteroidetes bacterium]|nr:single-stranded-DNA-specific exonuclease RecJ [Bacteroidota bacterium]